MKVFIEEAGKEMNVSVQQVNPKDFKDDVLYSFESEENWMTGKDWKEDFAGEEDEYFAVGTWSVAI